MPDELHLEVRRYPRRVEPYWNGGASVISTPIEGCCSSVDRAATSVTA
jgi:hypothetical protein